MKNPFSLANEFKKSYLLTILLSLLPVLPVSAQLSGKFSVASGKQVQFSSGNLVYNCSSGTWSFASSQYSVIGTSNSTNINNKSGSIDLFGWGTSGYNNCLPTQTSLSDTYGSGSSIAGTQYDWGVKNKSGYRTLTNSEWSYLLSSRTNASALRGPATVNGVCGWILLPDNWSQPSGVSFTSREAGATSFSANTYTTSQFSTMQSAGAVFLPAAGWRYSSGSANVTSYVNSQGYYWTANSGTAVSLAASYCTASQSAANYSGCAVRLVKDASGSGGGGSTTQCTITTKVEPDGKGTITGGGTFPSGTKVTLTAVPYNSEWELDYFDCNLTAYGYVYTNPWSFTLSRDMTVTAKFYQKKYPVYGEASPKSKGSVSPSSDRLVKGATVTFTATPSPGCKFVQWSDGVTTPTRTYTITGTEDDQNNKVVFTAEFESVRKFTITPVSANPEMGSVSEPMTVWAGEYANVSAYPKSGHKFTQWTNPKTTQTNTSNPLHMTLSKDTTVYAHFAPLEKISLTVIADPADFGTVSGGGNYTERDPVTLVATPGYRKKFIQWESDRYGSWQYESNEATYTFNAGSTSANYRAVFEELPYYTVTLAKTEGGTAKIINKSEDNKYLEGETIYLEFNPNRCYYPDTNQVYIDSEFKRGRSLPYVVSENATLYPRFIYSRPSEVKVRSESTEYGAVRIQEVGMDFRNSVSTSICMRDTVTMEAQSQDNAVFVRWSYGSNNNPPYATDNPFKYVKKDNAGNNPTFTAQYLTFGGYCGDPVLEDAWWRAGAGQFHFEGTGKVKKFSTLASGYQLLSYAPWANINGEYDLFVHESITYLPSYTFCSCGPINAYLQESSITEIVSGLFSYSPVKRIVLPPTVTKIENYAFDYCNALECLIFTREEPAPMGYEGIYNYILHYEKWNQYLKKICVPDGTLQAYIDAGYKNINDVRSIVEWHRVNVEVEGNGICRADTTNYVATGDTVTLTIKPATGKQLLELLITTPNGDTVPMWDENRFVMPEHHVTVKATFGIPKPTYTIRFLNYDGTELLTKQVQEGSVPVYSGATPTKPSTEQYDYTFSGWQPALTAVTGDATYTATYSQTTRQYTIRFVNWDMTELQATEVAYGTMPVYKGATPTKPSDDKNSYSFSGWSPQLTTVKETATYVAQFTPTAIQYFTIRFLNWNGDVLQSESLKAGTLPVYKGENPTRPDTKRYTYSFNGWKPEIVVAATDADYVAQYTAKEKEVVECHEVSAAWLDANSSGLGEMTTTDATIWKWDTKYKYAKATKQGGYTGWLLTPEKDLRNMESISLVFSHTHKFAGTPSDELTLWVCGDYKGSVESSEWQQITIPKYGTNSNWTFVDVTVNVPVDMVGEHTVFGFKYMSTASAYATWEIKNMTLKSVCPEVEEDINYTIVFKNWDGTVLQSSSVAEGELPVYTGSTPTRPEDTEFTYAFSGWSPTIVVAERDAEYTAQYTATKKEVVIECHEMNAEWLNANSEGLGEITTTDATIWKWDTKYKYAKGSKQGGHTGWLLTPEKDLRNVKSITLAFSHTHKFAGTPSEELTLWMCGDYKGSVDSSAWQQIIIPLYAANTNWTFVDVTVNVPVDKAGEHTVFGFKYMSTTSAYATWEIKNITLKSGCQEEDINYYVVRFFNWDGAALQFSQVKENDMPVYTGSTPTKPEDEQYIYTFSQWTPAIVAAVADADYTAQFTSMPKQQGIEDLPAAGAPTKILLDNVIYILRGNRIFTLTGQEVK